jgi:hypothetical protein
MFKMTGWGRGRVGKKKAGQEKEERAKESLHILSQFLSLKGINQTQ